MEKICPRETQDSAGKRARKIMIEAGYLWSQTEPGFLGLGSLPFSNLMINSQNFINVSKPKNSIEKYKAPALEKGLDILEFLADFPEGLSKVDIA